jgi:hypothetical protein
MGLQKKRDGERAARERRDPHTRILWLLTRGDNLSRLNRAARRSPCLTDASTCLERLTCAQAVHSDRTGTPRPFWPRAWRGRPMVGRGRRARTGRSRRRGGTPPAPSRRVPPQCERVCGRLASTRVHDDRCPAGWARRRARSPMSRRRSTVPLRRREQIAGRRLSRESCWKIRLRARVGKRSAA